MDLGLKLVVLRYLCHQLDKTIKNKFDSNNIRGFDKFERAAAIFIVLKDTEFSDAPDVKWAYQVLEQYRLWVSGKKKNFVVKRSSSKKIDSREKRSFENIIYKRRSVRFWDDKEIPKATINDIIKMGTMAPSSCNRQPWQFVIVENMQKRPLNSGADNRSMILNAPYILYVAIDERLYSEKYGPALDAGIVMQNLLLAIEYFGLKACGMYQCENVNQKRVADKLGLPAYFYIYAAIPFGFPAEEVQTPGRVTPDRVTRFIKLDTNTIL